MKIASHYLISEYVRPRFELTFSSNVPPSRRWFLKNFIILRRKTAGALLFHPPIPLILATLARRGCDS